MLVVRMMKRDEGDVDDGDVIMAVFMLVRSR